METAIKIEEGVEKLQALDFPVESAPAYLANGKEIEGHRAIVRPDTGAVLGLVSDQYKLVTHKQSLDPHLSRLIGKGWTVGNVTLEKNGARSWVELRNRQETREVKKGDVVGSRLLLTNSYDGSTGVVAQASYLVLWCTNGATRPEGGVRSSLRHTGGVFDNIEEQADTVWSDFDKTVNLYRGLADTSVSPEIARAVVQEVCGQRKLDLVTSFYKRGHAGDNNPTAWNLYNSITWYLTHEFGGAIATREAKNREAIDLLTHPEKVRQIIENQRREKAGLN